MSSPLYFLEVPTPIGSLYGLTEKGGALVALAFADQAELARLAGCAEGEWSQSAEHTGAAVRELNEYLRGERRVFSVVLAPRIGSVFQRRVWQALASIPYGQTWSYAQLAATVGSVARAVGGANGANPLPVVWPCHRVIGADGSLVGYAGGLERKVWLLRHEGALAAERQSQWF